MQRKFHLAAAALVAILAGGFGAHAGEGGGGGGGGGSTETGGAGAHGFFNANPGRPAIPGRALIAPQEPYGSTVLPGGTYFRLDGFAGNRDALVVSPDHGLMRAKHIRTTYNRHTGITTIWLRNEDGTRTGIHTDRDGNQMVSHHGVGGAGGGGGGGGVGRGGGARGGY